ncbi:zf-DNL-domain-containing protein [Punctularia strigosozonata HHB-11173 SS5]|uniref:Zf-DNL-domain-containing protein n=1 Tax=Punctularia strigosozonata (strain HHB-11173) TaxID=741275 RepID=R7S2A5_PUNST|nr:zf-DNL-domain-containing protein [Punctularia strigosozonata HHB-11173 SS5]EIN03912.1 zf-DNL-domain-containing protein [Punctularia strigosozonata HHB-11173 SS5]
MLPRFAHASRAVTTPQAQLFAPLKRLHQCPALDSPTCSRPFSRRSSSSASSSSPTSSSTTSCSRSSSRLSPRSSLYSTTYSASLSSSRRSFTSSSSAFYQPPKPDPNSKTSLHSGHHRNTPAFDGPGGASAECADPPQNALSPPPADSPGSQVLGKIEQRLQITFTCTVTDCGTRSSHEFTKRSYERGIVIVQCPGCQNRHLIADHLGWFKESTEDGKLRTVEDLMRAKGEQVRRGHIDGSGEVVEYAPES